MYDYMYGICREDYFYIDPVDKSNFIMMDKYEMIEFIDSYLHGKIEKRIVDGTDERVCSYYIPGESEPIAFSRLMPYGFNEFCRKVGCLDVRRDRKNVRYDRFVARVS